MLNKMFNYGAIGGLIAGVLMFAFAAILHVHPAPQHGAMPGYLVMVAAALPIFVAIRRYRAENSRGDVGIVPAIALGLAVAAITAAVYALCWELVLAWSGMDYGAEHAAQMLADAQAQGMQGAALDDLTAQLRQWQSDYASTPQRLAFSFMESFPVGAVMAVVSALLLANPRFMPLRGAARRR
ncbi:MAG: DUF4199 domain-containing protein [Xanthomonadales bacterium]|nr:DUF4199 domain-containing protein [Xanthomonadales bacterium]MCC6596286.1 DUF4199 domain-containing protein [Rhodanobacteraceae bacterium]MDL1868351.1 DUF4199 domain-containing protein [Gammaproteobacteria bacterium PRO6]